MKIKKQLKLNRKQKNLIGLSIILVLIIIILIIVLNKNTSSTLEQSFHIPNNEDITKVVIKDRENRTVTLERQSDSLWTVNKNYTANMVLVKTILETFKDMRVREPLPKAARNNVIKDLASNGKTVEVYTQEYLIDFWFIHLLKRVRLKNTYFVGHETPDEQGTFMLKKGDKDPYVVYIPNFRGYLSTRFSAVEDSWRSHVIFQYKQNDIDHISVEIPEQENEGFTLKNNQNGFSFITHQGDVWPSFDTTKVLAFLSSFVQMNYERIAKNISKIEQDTIFSKQPSFIISVTDKKGKTNTLKTYVKLSDPASIAEGDDDFFHIFDINRCYAISNTFKDTLVMQFFTLDNVLKPASYFMQEQD